eukprot:scaffold11939_cov93-Skeletonema_menzelii.AAC.1
MKAMVKKMNNSEHDAVTGIGHYARRTSLGCAISACSELNGMTMTLLHAAVRFNPPLDIVAQMI